MASLSKADLKQRFDVGFELGPTLEAVEAGNPELRLGDRGRTTGLLQFFGLISKVAKVGMGGEADAAIRETGPTWKPPFVAAPDVRFAGRKKVKMVFE
jgi:hypothetical protein